MPSRRTSCSCLGKTLGFAGSQGLCVFFALCTFFQLTYGSGLSPSFSFVAFRVEFGFLLPHVLLGPTDTPTRGFAPVVAAFLSEDVRRQFNMERFLESKY